MSDFMKETEKYVILREDGKFYYKGNASSVYGFTDVFSGASIFNSVKGAESGLYTAKPMKAEVRPVTITLED